MTADDINNSVPPNLNEDIMTQENQNAEAETPETEPVYSLEKAVAEILQDSKEDKTAPFQPEALRILVLLQQENPAQFEKLRNDLQSIGVVVGRLDAAVSAQKKAMRAQAATGNKNQTDDLLGIASAADYFRDPDEVPYADVIDENGCRHTMGVNSEDFKRWLRKEFYKKNKAAIAGDVFKNTIATLAARAITEGDVRPVALRCTRYEGDIYIDLCNEKRQAIKITKDGWSIIDTPPIRFRRRRGMKALPEPESGGSINDLRPFVNVRDEKSFVLLVSWLLAASGGHGPFPVLIVIGEQGTAKSTLMSLMRQLVDPNAAPLRTLPREVRDLFIAANSAYVLGFDNLSNMRVWISDALCRLATGGGFATRTLYTDEDEMLFNAMRPIMMNGIENVAPRGDLIDRALVLTLEPIPDNERKTAKEVQAAFDAAAPRILGTLLDMMAHGLRRLPDTKLDSQPRMADFAEWVSACETKAWPEGTFMKAYKANRIDANEDVLAASVLATAVREFMNQRNEADAPWEGTATEMLGFLRAFADENALNDRRIWPSTSRVLSERLRRDASALRQVGIIVEHKRGEGSARHIRLSRAPVPDNPATCADAPTSRETAETEAKPIAANKMPKYQRIGGSKGKTKSQGSTSRTTAPDQGDQ